MDDFVRFLIQHAVLNFSGLNVFCEFRKLEICRGNIARFSKLSIFKIKNQSNVFSVYVAT